MNNTLLVDTPREKVRKHPATVFGHEDIKGVQMAFNGLVQLFGREAYDDHGDEVEIYFSESEPDLEIRMKGDRGLQLGETLYEGIEWKKRLTDVIIDVEDYHEFLFSSDGKKAHWHYPIKDSIYFYPVLASNQLVCEKMTVISKSAEHETEKFIRFIDGEPAGTLNERSDGEVGTSLQFCYDNKVFTKVQLDREFMEKCLDDAAILYPRVKFRLFIKKADSDETEEKVFCYEDTLEVIETSVNYDYFDLFNGFREIVDKDNAVSDHKYYAKMGIVGTFSLQGSMTKSFFNGYKLTNGGLFADEFFKVLDRHIKLLCRNNGIEADIPVEKLREHTSVLFIVETADCIPYWRDGRRTALDNRMLADMAGDICEKQVKNFIDNHEKNMLRWVNGILEEMK